MIGGKTLGKDMALGTFDAGAKDAVPATGARRDNASELDRFLAGVERRAYRMAVVAVGNADDALDLVQDAMYKLVQRYATRPAEEWPPLFYRILYSRINDCHRRRMVRNAVGVVFGNRNRDESNDEDPIERVAGLAAEQPDQRLQQRRAVDQAYQALERLPRRQREAFMLRAWEGLDTADTARAMGCTEGSVKTHYSRALHSLRAQLEDHWP
jgi:RNA polymerase sigma-70 factor (ECF subfamily)